MASFNFHKFNLSILILVSVFVFQGCGGDTKTESVTNSETMTNPETLAESLDRLGVDTEITPRMDSQGNPYPEEYAPMGDVMTVRQIDPADANVSTEPNYVTGRPEELFLGGVRLDNSEAVFSVLDDISLAGKSESEALLTTPDILEGRTIEEVPWAVESNSTNRGEVPAGTRRDSTAMDSNGNGFLDAVTVYAVANNAGYDELYLQIMDGNNATKVPDVQLFNSDTLLPVYDLRVTADDFDGDGRDELAVAVARTPSPGNFNTPVELYIFDDAYSGYVMLDEYTVTYTASFAEPSVTLSLTGFHADHDRQDELALVVNESEVDNNSANYATRLFVFNLIGSDLQQQTAGPITAEVRDSDGIPRNATAVRASVTAGDLDGDGLDELITGGFEEIVENCREYIDDFGVPYVDPIKYTLFAYGGHYNDFAPVRAGTMEVFPPCKIESGSEPYVMRHVHLNVLDFDNDEDMDIQFNDLVLETVPQRNWKKSVIAFLDDNRILYGDTQRTYFDRSDSVMSVSDQTGDGVKDILSLSMYPNENDPYIRIYTWDDNASNNYYRLATRIKINDVDYNNGNKNPILLAMDVNNDKVTQLRYTGEHFMDITEPIVLSVLAAPPCKFDIGQDSCYTSWGNTLSGAVGAEHSVTVFGSAGVGFGTAGAGAYGEWLFTVSASASWTRSLSYELSKSQTFSTGPGEDGVIFTSIPMDRYLYKVIYNSTDGVGDVGDEIEIRLPRTPGIRIVSRSYYNANIIDDAEPIDERVFQHIPGNTGSYPTASQKDVILASERSILEDARLVRFEGTTQSKYDIVDALEGLEVGPVYVGQGGGSTELSLEYSESNETSNALAVAFSTHVKFMAGPAWEFELGIEKGRTLSVSHGNSTLYSGSVDSIDADFYADNFYGFGLFTYLQNLGDREIEVINFWVEE